MQNSKIGFANLKGEIVIEPEFDNIFGSFYGEHAGRDA
jgi:hypothetical protein